jgi:enhancing lycopene biosynthesis protein 2
MSKNVLVILSGSGVFDGTEIHEAVIALLALDKAGANAVCAAPNKKQMHVINHATGDEMDEQRNVLVEAARISRGNITDLADVVVDEYDALFMPGGFGAAKNLCTFATEGANCSIDGGIERVLKEFHAAGKPIGAVCISPAVVVRALGNVTVTIGSDPGTADALSAMGGVHANHAVEECHIDHTNKVITAPAYMVDSGIAQVAAGIEAAVGAVLEMA